MEFSILEESMKHGSEDYWRKMFKKDLEPTIINFSRRGLLHTAKWLSELFYTLRNTDLDEEDISAIPIFPEEDSCYHMCKCYFDLREYDRCAYFAEKSETPCTKFLRFYAKYLSLEKKRVEDMTEPSSSLGSSQTTALSALRAELEEEKIKNGLDGYGSYLYGIVCRKLNLRVDALEALCESVRKEPLHFGAWQEIVHLVDDVRQVKTLDIPHDHWMKLFFMGYLFMEHQMNTAAINVFFVLRQRGLSECRYIRAQVAISYHNQRVVDKGIEEFQILHSSDPYRLENLDSYSNLLYIKEEKVLVSHLAHRACEIDKYRVETCCIVGNLYSLRGEHQKAVLYFQRALKINPQYLSAWTLMGHEYMEMKNSCAAIQSYRHAIEANKRDYRAWYGLGQTYEILKMPSYGLYYYQQAHMVRPNDSRMLLAIGDTFEKLGQNNNALRSYKLARNVGDIEGIALIKLAKLMQKLGNFDMTAMLYKEFALEFETREEKNELCHAYKFLASYYLRNNMLIEANEYAQKCFEYEETKEEAKALLIDIDLAQRATQKDIEVEIVDSPMEEETITEEVATTTRRLWDSPPKEPESSIETP